MKRNIHRYGHDLDCFRIDLNTTIQRESEVKEDILRQLQGSAHNTHGRDQLLFHFQSVSDRIKRYLREGKKTESAMVEDISLMKEYLGILREKNKRERDAE